MNPLRHKIQCPTCREFKSLGKMKRDNQVLQSCVDCQLSRNRRHYRGRRYFA
ncbi:hypothetical protein [Salinicola halophyticus]|uniref:hypothetical protein n=1 Tax=Salinicola halophyticus TaxID=1808881 RepID=UPI003F4518D2